MENEEEKDEDPEPKKKKGEYLGKLQYELRLVGRLKGGAKGEDLAVTGTDVVRL